MFLKIENPGVCTIEEMIVLGLSTARDNVDKIGQFGSGSKNAINVLLRHGISPIIYLGKTKVEFFAEPRRTRNKNYSLVCYRIGNKKRETGFALEMGELDWNHTDMALREIVSNAIDSVDDANSVTIEITEKTRAKGGTTRVFIPLTQNVQMFHNGLFDRFLNFDNRITKTILDKTEEGPARIYRKGVLVRQLESRQPNSIFDYNVGEDLKIDEARNLDDYSVMSACARVLRTKSTKLETVFKALRTNNDIWEGRFSQYHLWDYTDSTKKIWQTAWKNAFGDAYVAQNLDVYAAQIAIDNGHKVVIIDNAEWYAVLKKAGINTVYSVVNEIEGKGLKIVDTTPNAQNTLDTVWNWFEAVELTKDKNKPSVGCFRQIKREDDKILLGYYDKLNSIIYINVEFDTNHKTMVEELIHYIGEVNDYSRNFQEFSLEMIVAICK